MLSSSRCVGARLERLARRRRATRTRPRPACPAARRSSARRTASRIPPASAMWLSLTSIASWRPMRWLRPPPAATACFSSSRRPGVVLRVSSTSTPVPRSRWTHVGGRGRDAGQVLEEVERDPLARQQRARVALDLGDRGRRLLQPLALGPDGLPVDAADRGGGRRPPRPRGRRRRPGAFCSIRARARVPPGSTTASVVTSRRPDVLRERACDQVLGRLGEHAADRSRSATTLGPCRRRGRRRASPARSGLRFACS